MNKEKLVKLSPSRIKTYISCSWLGWSKYQERAPDKTNNGSARGSCIHYVLECLANPKHKEKFDLIINTGNIFSCAPVYRLALNHAKKLRVSDDANMQMISDFILVALKTDFYREGADEIHIEKEFDYSNGKYRVGGFMDILAVYHKEKKVRCIDYKSSKAKFSKEEMEYNIQGMVYAMICKKWYPDYEVEMVFEFLKFKKDPIQARKYTQEELDGMEKYLEHVSEYLQDFDLQKAFSNFAWKNIKNKWLCGKELGQFNVAGEPAFVCSMKYPFVYFKLVDKEGKLIKASRDKSDLEPMKKPEMKIVTGKYEGCPQFKHLF